MCVCVSVSAALPSWSWKASAVIFWVTIIRGLKMSTDVQLRGSCDPGRAPDRHYYIRSYTLSCEIDIRIYASSAFPAMALAALQREPLLLRACCSLKRLGEDVHVVFPGGPAENRSGGWV